MRLVLVCIALLAVAFPAAAAPGETVLFLDGVRYRVEATAVRGVAEVSLPAAVRPDSLRVRPLGGAAVSRVEMVPARLDRRAGQEIDRLVERRDALRDRLKALEVREEIFRSAAKAQSGKAPRRSKTNPEPVAAIRQGTEYAISQMEDVYRVRRRVEKESSAVEARLAALRKDANVGGSVVRAWLVPPGGKAMVSYAVEGAGWKPFYDFRLDGGGSALVTLRAIVPPDVSGPVTVVNSRLSDTAAGVGFPVRVDFGVVETIRLPVERERYQAAPLSSLQFSVKNQTGRTLLAGDVAGYWKGEYLGRTKLPAIQPEGAIELRFGSHFAEQP